MSAHGFTRLLTLKSGLVLFQVLVHSSMKEYPPLLAASTCKIYDTDSIYILFTQQRNITKMHFQIDHLSFMCAYLHILPSPKVHVTVNFIVSPQTGQVCM